MSKGQKTILVLLITYCEVIFTTSTTKCTVPAAIITNVTFSVFYGFVIYSLLQFVSGLRAQRIIGGIIVSVTPVIFYAQFLIYRSFKVFYDVNTCINGAGGALTNFRADISRLIFCFDGISHLLLFYLPLVLYLSLPKGIGRRRLKKTVYILITIVLFAIARLLVNSNIALRDMYTKQYNYQTVVEHMGLITGLRLDIYNILKGQNEDVEFDFEESDDTFETGSAELYNPYGSDEPAEYEGELLTGLPVLPDSDDHNVDNIDSQTCDNSDLEEDSNSELPKEYGYNSLDIDFEELSENASQTNANLDLYVNSLTPSKQNEYTGLFEGKNLIFITAEAFSGYVVDPELTPTLYRLIHEGIYFEDYYQPAVAGTTGGEYANLFGLLATSGGKSMKIITSGNTFITMGNQLNNRGYWGRAYHNNTNTIYSRNETHNLLGYSEGFEGVGDGMENYLTTPGFPSSDKEMIEGTLTEYIDHQPFNVYYMTVSGHGQYGPSINQMTAKNWNRVSELEYSKEVKSYIANNLELEDALAYLVNALEEAGIADDTVICLSPDHFPYGLDRGSSPGNMPELSELYGINVSTYLERDRNACIIWSGCLEEMDPIVVSAPTFSLDILPTLCNLFGIVFDSRLLPGRDVFSDAEAIIFDGSYDWKTELGTYYSGRNKFVPVSDDIDIPEDYISRINTIVKNKYTFCKGVLSDDYYGHVYEAVKEAIEKRG